MLQCVLTLSWGRVDELFFDIENQKKNFKVLRYFCHPCLLKIAYGNYRGIIQINLIQLFQLDTESMISFASTM